MTLDTRRHDELFDKKTFAADVHVIGAGGVGSALVRQLAKLGVGTNSAFHLWDGDTVAPHNIANQAYDPHDIDLKKTDALREHVRVWTDGIEAISHDRFVTDKVPLSGMVFLCLDDMQARKDICEASLWGNEEVPMVIETRMDASYIVIHSFDPNDPLHVECWNEYWYPDVKTENEAGCGGPVSVISTVEMTASMAVQQFIAHVGGANDFYHQVQLNLRTWELKKATWQ